MEKETSALEAVTLAGRFMDRAVPDRARILHRRPDGGQDAIEVDLTDPKTVTSTSARATRSSSPAATPSSSE